MSQIVCYSYHCSKEGRQLLLVNAEVLQSAGSVVISNSWLVYTTNYLRHTTRSTPTPRLHERKIIDNNYRDVPIQIQNQTKTLDLGWEAQSLEYNASVGINFVRTLVYNMIAWNEC